MLRVFATLLGFALFGALFASVYYEPENHGRVLAHPKYGLAPGESKADYVESGRPGERISVNLSVIGGGPVSVHVMRVEALEPLVDGNNSTIRLVGPVNDSPELSRERVEGSHFFQIVSDGVTRYAILTTALAPWNASRTLEEQVTEISVKIRYLEREAKDLLMGYLMALPSVVLIGYTLQRHARRRRRERLGVPDASALPPPAPPAKRI